MPEYILGSRPEFVFPYGSDSAERRVCMANGFFRERRHYQLHEIANELQVTIEEAKRLTGTLKKYGIVKAVRASDAQSGEFTDQDAVLADVSEDYNGIDYIFDFVGVVLAGENLFQCYPKYIRSETKPFSQLKQVLQVIKKYNEKAQMFYLSGGDGEDKIFNSLAAALYLMEDYFQYGLYTNQHEMIETNGSGGILWDKTIHETFALIKNGQPFYMQLQTRNTADNEMDYFTRLHACVLSMCTEKLKDAGILDLFDLAQADLSSQTLDDFGDTDFIRYRLESEMRTQFVTRKQILLKTMDAYIANEKAGRQHSSFSFYGTNSFHVIWEKVCAHNFGNMLDHRLTDLPLGVPDAFASRKNSRLKEIIERPVWHKKNPRLSDGTADTLKPDLIRIYPFGGNGEYCFGIYDAKYYCIDFKIKEDGCRVTGQPGIADITKQYLYQLAYEEFITAQGYDYVQNMFLCPKEDAARSSREIPETEYGYAEMGMMRQFCAQALEHITVVKLSAPEMFELYLADKKIENLQDYIPAPGRKRTAYYRE